MLIDIVMGAPATTARVMTQMEQSFQRVARTVFNDFLLPNQNQYRARKDLEGPL